LRGEEIGDVPDQLLEIEILALELQLARFELREVEHVVEQREQPARGSLHGLRELALVGVELGAEQQLRHTEHAVHRRADLVAHVREELGLGARRVFRGVARFGELRGARVDLPFDVRVGELELGAAERDLVHLSAAAPAHVDEEDVLEDDPPRVLEPAPVARREHPEHRFGPVRAAQRVIERDDQRRAHEHAGVAVEGQEGQRSEDVEVRLDASSAEVDEERRAQRLADRDRVAREVRARAEEHEQHRSERDRTAEVDGEIHVDVGLADGADPGQGCEPEGRADRREPLHAEEPGEEPIGRAVPRGLLLREQVPRACRDPRLGPLVAAATPDHGTGAHRGEGDSSVARSWRGQPKTAAEVPCVARPRTRSSTASSPRLSPA
jgi:hypothetical protein